MSTLKVNDIVDTGGHSLLGRRNLIINGAMQVAQRGTSFTNHSGYTLDRWFVGNPSTNSISQGYDSTLGMYYLDVTTSSTWGTYQKIENVNYRHLRSGDALTVSYWMKGNNPDPQLAINCGNSANTINLNSFNTLETKGSWKRYSKTFTVSSAWQTDIDNGLHMYFEPKSGESSFQLTGVQLEVGSTATPFEHRSYGEELALCQRYYWRWVAEHPYNNISMANVVTGSNNTMSTVPMPVTLRAHPSISWGGNMRIYSFAAATERQINNILLHRGNPHTVGLSIGWATALSGANSTPCEFGAMNDSNAYVAFDAEL